MADVTFRGSINGASNTSATVMGSLTCTNSFTPTGSVSGTIQFPSGSTTRKFTFHASGPFVVASIDQKSFGAAFDNLTLQEGTDTPITGASGYFNGTKVSSNSWIGSFTIVAPNGEQLFIYGQFTGSLVVNRQIFCRPLL